jgi:hypothetical protein
MLWETDIEYSSKLWDEIKYELGSAYSNEDISVIEMALSGGAVVFHLAQMEERFSNLELHSAIAQKLASRRSVREILSDLYRLGAIGNSFRVGTTGTNIRNRWSYRGDPNLLPDKQMTIHPALVKRLSAVKARRRGVAGGNRYRRFDPTLLQDRPDR